MEKHVLIARGITSVIGGDKKTYNMIVQCRVQQGNKEHDHDHDERGGNRTSYPCRSTDRRLSLFHRLIAHHGITKLAPWCQMGFRLQGLRWDHDHA